jgi:hypothetical protein
MSSKQSDPDDVKVDRCGSLGQQVGEQLYEVKHSTVWFQGLELIACSAEALNSNINEIFSLNLHITTDLGRVNSNKFQYTPLYQQNLYFRTGQGNTDNTPTHPQANKKKKKHR